MRVPETAPLTASLFARKGEASSEGFVQPAPEIPRRRMTPGFRHAAVVLALPVAYLCAAVVGIVSLDWSRSETARVVPQTGDRKVAAVPSPAPAVVVAGPPAAAAPPIPAVTARPKPLPALPETADREPASPPLKPVNAAYGVPPAPPLKPLTAAVALAGTAAKGILHHSPPPGRKGRYWIQLASLDSPAAVYREWARLKSTHGTAFQGLRLMVEPSPSGAFYRLQAGPVKSRAAARKLCARLRRPPTGCFVVVR